MGAEGRRACPPVHLKCVIGGWDELDKPGETGEAERDNRSDRTKDARMKAGLVSNVEDSHTELRRRAV